MNEELSYISLGIVGSRSITDYTTVSRIIDDVRRSWRVAIIISGGAEHDIPVETFLPNWKELGDRAGFIRNKYIVDRSTYVLAIWDGVSPGTKDSIKHARKQDKLLGIVYYSLISGKYAKKDCKF
jgi:hypothetical protein